MFETFPTVEQRFIMKLICKPLIVVLGTLAFSQAYAADRTGDVIYKAKCVICHASGVAGAPKIGDKAAWAPRIAKGMDVLYTNSLKGINAMPAKGTCSDCSDAEVKAAVDYMVEQSK